MFCDASVHPFLFLLVLFLPLFIAGICACLNVHCRFGAVFMEFWDIFCVKSILGPVMHLSILPIAHLSLSHGSFDIGSTFSFSGVSPF